MTHTAPVFGQQTLKPPHPVAYSVLIIPFGAMSGYVSVAMAFLCTRFNLTVQDGAMLIAAGMFPHVWKFLWAPVVDTTLSRKRWYLISVVLCAVGITAMSAIPMSPSNLHLLEVVIVIANVASTFLGMSVEGLMAHATPPDQRGRVGGWFQAGNLGGAGLGGGAGLWMATHLPAPWMSGAALGLCFLAGSAALWFVPEAVEEKKGVEKSVSGRAHTGLIRLIDGAIEVLRVMWGVAVELWQTIRSRGGFLCAVLCMLPMNTGAAAGVLAQAEVAAKWGVAEDTVSLVNGVLNGVISALGCLAGSPLCTRFGSRRTYAAVAVLMAGVSVAMALSPFTSVSYVVYALVYAFVVGLAYTAFTGFVLDAIGKGAAATKYNAFASLSNAPIAYMGLVLAWSQTHWGEKGLLFTDAAAGLVGLVLLGVVVSILTRGGRLPLDPAPIDAQGSAAS